MKFFENTSSPDEMVVQTILANSAFRSRMRRNLTYADWSDGATSPSPIGERHLALFWANPVLKADGPYGSGEYLFCRKVMDAAHIGPTGGDDCRTNRDAWRTRVWLGKEMKPANLVRQGA